MKCTQDNVVHRSLEPVRVQVVNMVTSCMHVVLMRHANRRKLCVKRLQQISIAAVYIALVVWMQEDYACTYTTRAQKYLASMNKNRYKCTTGISDVITFELRLTSFAIVCYLQRHMRYISPQGSFFV